MTTGRPGKPKLDDPTWIALLERSVRGETASAPALEYGAGVWAIAWRARNRGYRKMDRPDAVHAWRQPPITPGRDAAGRRGFDHDPGDLDGSIVRASARAKRAAAEGRMRDVARIEQAVERLRRALLPHEGEES